MGTDGCRRFPISRRYSKRSASSFSLSPSVSPMASSTNSRTFLIWVTVSGFRAETPNNGKRNQTSWFATPKHGPTEADGCTSSVSAARASRSWAASGRDSSSPTASLFCMNKQALENRWNPLSKLCPVLYLHLLPNAFAAEVLGFVEVVCFEAACEGKRRRVQVSFRSKGDEIHHVCRTKRIQRM